MALTTDEQANARIRIFGYLDEAIQFIPRRGLEGWLRHALAWMQSNMTPSELREWALKLDTIEEPIKSKPLPPYRWDWWIG